MRALGLNCGAGTLLLGASKYFSIEYNFSNFELGLKTCSVVHGLPSTSCSKDYSEVPKPEVDAIFANASSWQEVQFAAKYLLVSECDFLIVDLRSSLWIQYESFFNDICKLVFKQGYRTVYLFYSAMSFDAGFSEGRMALVIHKKTNNFNIMAPKLPEQLRHVHSYIKDLVYKDSGAISHSSQQYGRNCHYVMSYDETLCSKKILRGWSLKQMIQYKYRELPGSSREWLQEIKDNPNFQDIRRPQWGRKLLSSNYLACRYLHPLYDRPLLIGEMMAICDWDQVPVGKYPMEQLMHGTPLPAGEWLALQATYWFENKWELQDWQVEYDKRKKKFKGGIANPLRPKKYIDISRYYNELYDKTDRTVFPVRTLEEDDEELILY